MSEDACIRTVFNLAVLRAFVGDLSAASAKELRLAETWLRLHSDGSRSNPSADVIVVGSVQ